MAIPVSLDDAKRQLRVDDNERDEEIVSFIADAADWVEGYTGHILVARDVTETFNGFGRMRLRAWPIKPNAAPLVTYADAGSATVTVPTPRVILASRPGMIVPSLGECWPSVAAGTPATVTIRAGYESDDRVPGNLRRAMLVLIAGYDADREGGEMFQAAEAAARRLCARFKARTL